VCGFLPAGAVSQKYADEMRKKYASGFYKILSILRERERERARGWGNPLRNLQMRSAD